MTSCRLLGVAAAASVSLVGAGCGGGSTAGSGMSGGGGSGAGTFSLLAGYTSLNTSGLNTSVTISGSLSGSAIAGSANLVTAPATSGTFNGSSALAQTTTITGTLTVNGVASPYASTSTAYYSTSHNALGVLNAGEYDVAQAPIVYPSSVVAGSTAALGTFSRYTNQTMSTPIGTDDVSYLVRADGTATSSVIVDIIEKIYDAGHVAQSTGTSSFRLTSAGAMTLVSASTVLAAGGNLSFTVP